MSNDLNDVGKRAKTLADRGGTHWLANTRTHVRWGETGEILVEYSDAGGIVYLVEHEDGTKAWYEGDEVEVLDEASGRHYAVPVTPSSH